MPPQKSTQPLHPKGNNQHKYFAQNEYVAWIKQSEAARWAKAQVQKPPFNHKWNKMDISLNNCHKTIQQALQAVWAVTGD